MGRKDKQTPSRCWERGRSPCGMHGALPASTPEPGVAGSNQPRALVSSTTKPPGVKLRSAAGGSLVPRSEWCARHGGALGSEQHPQPCCWVLLRCPMGS